jgi:hypothetical protein
LGGPKEIPVSDKRTNPKDGISFGGAKKAERKQEQGAVERSVLRRTRDRKGELIRTKKSCSNEALFKRKPERTANFLPKKHLNPTCELHHCLILKPEILLNLHFYR